MWKPPFNEKQLRELIRTMTPRSKFYRVLREELKAIGRWKNLPRGRHTGRKT